MLFFTRRFCYFVFSLLSSILLCVFRLSSYAANRRLQSKFFILFLISVHCTLHA